MVANEDRLDDVMGLAARLANVFSGQRRFHTFAMNHVAHAGPDLCGEDYLAIADLAAGMVAEVTTMLAPRMYGIGLGGLGYHDAHGRMTARAELVADWFWDVDNPLKPTCAVVWADGEQSGCVRLEMR
ncbi:hypothetical protein MASR1M32_12220 [Rhodobacter sp.]